MTRLRVIAGTTRGERRRDDDIRQQVKVRRLGEKIKKARVRWFGHVRRREPHHITRRVMEGTKDGKRPHGRPRKRWMDCVKGDLSRYNIEEG